MAKVTSGSSGTSSGYTGPGAGSVSNLPHAPKNAPPPKDGLNHYWDGFVVDTDLLHKYGHQLIAPADRVGAAADHIDGQAKSLTDGGKPPWGDGEIGNKFQQFYDDQAVKLLEAVREMQQAIYGCATIYGVVSDKYVKNEDDNLS